eukprot:7039855-Prymnesium_polylepis.1
MRGPQREEASGGRRRRGLEVLRGEGVQAGGPRALRVYDEVGGGLPMGRDLVVWRGGSRIRGFGTASVACRALFGLPCLADGGGTKGAWGCGFTRWRRRANAR